MSKLIADKELRENIKAMVFRVYGGDHPQGWDKTIDNIIGYVERERTAAQQQLLTELLEQLPNKLTDISGYHEDYTPEQLTRITAANRAHNQTIAQVVSIINNYLTKEGK